MMNVLFISERWPLLRVFGAGLFISFLGALPLGTLNVLAARIAVEAGVGPAVGFSFGALLVEMGYVWLSLVAMERIRRRGNWMRVLERVMLAVLFLLAIGSFWAAGHAGGGSVAMGGGGGAVMGRGGGMSGGAMGSVLPGSIAGMPGSVAGDKMGGIGVMQGMSVGRMGGGMAMGGFSGWGILAALLAGMGLSAINPLQIPFWLGWSTVLYDRGVLRACNDHRYTYILGIGLGTFAGMGVFIGGSRLFAGTLARNGHILNLVIGVIFLVTALIQWRKMRSGRTEL